MRSLVILLAAVGLTAPLGASAQSLPKDFPKYEINKRCSDWASRDAGGSEASRQVCVRDNQFGYDYARSVWSEALPETKARCIQIVTDNERVSGPIPLPYATIASCLSQLIETDRLKAQQPFRY